MADTSTYSMVLNNETSAPQGVTDSSENKSNLVRLVEDNTVEKTIKKNLDELSVPSEGDPIDPQGGNHRVDQMGMEYPMIRINDEIVPKASIKKFILSENSFMPTVSLILTYLDTKFISKSMPKDGDIMSIFMRTNTSTIEYIRNDYIITSCAVNISKTNASTNTVNISGKLFVPGFDSAYGCSGFTGTSRSVLRQIAKKFGIGFAFNDYDNTDDYQSWIRCNESYDSFVESIVSHAWKDETSFFSCWIDIYYNLCYSNVNKFLLTTENSEEVDITMASETLNAFNLLKKTEGPTDSKSMVKVFSNSSEFKGTPFFIKSWHPVNNSTATSMSMGYSVTSYTFLHNPNLVSSDSEKCFESLENIPAYDQQKTDTYMLLRGRATYDPEQNPEDEKARANHDFVNTYIKKEWKGIEYVMSDSDCDKDPNEWSGNVHKNYSRAVEHNTINLSELNKMYIEIECEGLCLQAMRGERIPVYITYGDTFDRSRVNTSETDTARNGNRLYSGYYLVDSMEIEYNPLQKTGSSPFTTKFVLKRREWPTPEQI